MTEGNCSIAPLKNVALASRALERAITRPQHLPGMVCLYGPSGFGKSFAAAYSANKYKAYYIECKSTWTRKAVLSAIAREMGLVPKSTLYDLTEQISAQLVIADRPLIVDEVDHLVGRNAMEIIRDLYEGSHVPVLLIGEENLPSNLKKSERFHGRILDFVPAQPADAADAKVLARFYCHRIKIADDLIEEVARRAKGSIRRICVNLAHIENESLEAGEQKMALPEWKAMGKGFWTGEAMVRGEFSR
jgi:hypothetical protein